MPGPLTLCAGNFDGGGGTSDVVPQLRAARIAIAFAIILAAIKATASLHTGSVALLASAMDSALDALASAINLFALRHALAPPDKEHRFGHGKAESLAGAVQAAFITGSVFVLVIEAVRRLQTSSPVVESQTGILVMMVAILATKLLIDYQRRVASRPVPWPSPWMPPTIAPTCSRTWRSWLPC